MDLEILAFGDQRIIGERGINLSGGQKQRIQIARALYQDVDIYLFDDPFSAVDAHTGSHLFKECLLGILSSKTVFYVTHQIEFLPTADLILVMKDRRITQAGKYNEILRSGTDFIALVGAHEEALSAINYVDEDTSRKTASEEDRSMISTNNITHEEDKTDIQDEKAVNANKLNRQLSAFGGALMPVILLSQVLFQILQTGSDYWMAWATPVSEDMEAPVSTSWLFIIFIAMAVGSSLCVLLRSTLLVTTGFKAATELFVKMHTSIFRAPMSFFDSTPSGRILNRASTDQSATDMDIPFQVGAFCINVIQLLGIIVVMSQVAWQVFIIFIPVMTLCIWYEQYYIPLARELSRLIGVCKAPVKQLLSETISGSTTIRSFDQESRFKDANMKLIDAYSRPKFHNAAAMEWLCFRLYLLSSITFASFLIFLITIPVGVIDPGIAGLSVIYGLNLNMLQTWLIWNLCNMENKMISVRYAPQLPLVLRGIACTFSRGKKIGIVGRTGSGKSTLIHTLFRIVDPIAGHIVIDNVNITTIGLHDLRSKLSIVPQDPTMFEGTVWSNLDPLEEYADEDIWEALDKCQLGDEVRKKEGKLHSPVSENGENWSMGQRQLVCLGRVLLQKNKVLVLDEATASIDTTIDNLVQQTLRQHFSEGTVITIAHRVTSVLGSDMVLLLSRGLIEEFYTPTRLLEDKSSSFSQLVVEYTQRSGCR
ncbi:unnamed protein product [Citrullus colocynthis]|uniref:ABC-type xenobiotic transporter n=1 Tax=Citrullus colocynthis TaxID=252529 RepID=A0ABP0XKL6_9ROSI